MELSFKTCILYLLWFSASTTSMPKAKKSGREQLVQPCCHSNIYICHPPPHFRNCGVFVLLLVQQWSSFSTSTSLLVLSHQSSLRLRSDSAGDSPPPFKNWLPHFSHLCQVSAHSRHHYHHQLLAEM